MFGVIKSRLCKYLLKRLFGRYLDEDLDTVKVAVEGDNLTVRNLRLRSGSGSHLSYLDSACADLVTVHMPWRSLLQDGCKITISGFTVEITNVRSEYDSSPTAPTLPPSSPSYDPYLHRALIGLFNNDYDCDNMDELGTEDVPVGSNKKSLDCVSDYIRQVFFKTQIEITDILLNFRPVQDIHFTAEIPSLLFQNGVLEFDEGAQIYEERFSEPILTINDSFHVSFNDHVLDCDVGTIQGSIPVSLLRSLILLKFSSFKSKPHSESLSTESKTVGDFANINQFKLNISNVAIILDSKEAQFGVNFEDSQLDVALAPKIAIRSCSIATGNIIDEVGAIPVLQFVRHARDHEPVVLLRPNRLNLQPMTFSVNVYTVYQLKTFLKESLPQIPESKGILSNSDDHSDFVVTMLGPIMFQYTGYLELLFNKPIVAVIGGSTTVVSIESSLIQIREVQQDPIVLFSSELTGSFRFHYANDSIPNLPTGFPNRKRTSSRIYQTNDFISADRDFLLLPVSYKLDYLDAATVCATFQLTRVEIHLNEHILAGLYSAFQNHSQKPAASAVGFSRFDLPWAFYVAADDVRVFYTTPKSKFSLLVYDGISAFASPSLMNASLSSFSLRKDCIQIISHVAKSADSANLAALEIFALWRNDHIELSAALKDIVISVNQDAFDLVECGMSLHAMVKKICSGRTAASNQHSSNRSFSFQSNIEDCAILFSSPDPSVPRLTLVLEKFSKTFSKGRLNVLLCGLSLHLIDCLPAPATFPSLLGSSLDEYLIDSGHVVIMSLDVAEGGRYLSTAFLNVGHIALMTCADTLTLTYRAGISIWEHVSPRLLAIASSPKSLETRFAVSQQHADVVALASMQVLSSNVNSGVPQALPKLNASEHGFSKTKDIELESSLILDDSANLCDRNHQSVSFIQESYDAVPSATLPNRNEVKAQYHSHFQVLDTYFTSIDQSSNEPCFFDQKVLGSDGSCPTLKLLLNLRIERIALKLFGGRDFRNSKVGNPVFSQYRSKGDVSNEDYMLDVCRFMQGTSTTPQSSNFSVNGSGRQRESTDIIEVVLSGLQLCRRSYTSSSSTSESHNFYGTLAGVVIHDHVRESDFEKVLGPMVKNRRSDRTKALTISIESVNATSYCAEHRVEIQLAPLDLTLDSATLAFAIKFATGIESVLESVVATPLEDESDTVQVLANLDPTVYVHFFECAATALNVTYRPSNLDMRCINGPADCIKLLQLLPVQDAMFELKQVSLRGLSGYTRVVCEVLQIWACDIARNQYHKYLGSIVPFRSMVRLGSSVRDLVFAPISHQLHNIIQPGGHSHGSVPEARSGNSIHNARQFGTETVSLAVVMLSGTEVILDSFDGRGTAQTYNSEPSGFCDGLRCALTSVAQGARLASHSVVGMPLREWRKHSGGLETFRSFIRGVPLAVLEPARAATHALKLTLQGLKNSIDADSAEQRPRIHGRRRR